MPIKVAEPPQAAPVTELPRPMPPIERLTGMHGIDVTMISSLPPMASGADVYARQYYRGSQVPFRRYLPLKGL